MDGDKPHSDPCPEQVPHLPHHRQRHSHAGFIAEQRRQRARARFVDADAKRHELERHRDDPVQRLEQDRFARVSGSRFPAASCSARYASTTASGVKAEVEREHAPQAERDGLTRTPLPTRAAPATRHARCGGSKVPRPMNRRARRRRTRPWQSAEWPSAPFPLPPDERQRHRQPASPPSCGDHHARSTGCR